MKGIKLTILIIVSTMLLQVNANDYVQGMNQALRGIQDLFNAPERRRNEKIKQQLAQDKLRLVQQRLAFEQQRYLEQQKSRSTVNKQTSETQYRHPTD